MKPYNCSDCLTWNCCDELLHECIDRSEFVRNIRRKLKTKKFVKFSNSLKIS